MRGWQRALFVVIPAAGFLALAYGVLWALGVRQHAPPLPVMGALPELLALDQDGKPVGLATLRNVVWVGSVLDGAEPEPGAPIVRTLRELQNTFKKTGSDVLLVTFCPSGTQAGVRALTARAGLPAERWAALWGPGVAEFLRTGLAVPLGVAVQAGDWSALASRLFVVDGQGRLRSVRDGMAPGGMAFLKADVGSLLREARGS